MTAETERARRRRVSVFGLALLLPWITVARSALIPIRDNSFLWHIRAGEIQAQAGAVLTSDPFSFTMQGQPWITQSWLAELLYFFGEEISDLSFVAPMVLVCGSVTFLGIALIAYRRSASLPATAAVVILSTVMLAVFLVPRPVLFSLPLFVLVILAWDRRSMRWTLPFLFWIWASVHGSFIIGLAWIGLSLIADRDWKALRTAFVSGVPTLLTAHGLGVIQMLLAFGESTDSLSYMSEWATPDLLTWSRLPYLLAILILIVGGMRDKLDFRSFWVTAPFLALGFTAIRAMAPAWLGLVPFLAVSLGGLQVRRMRGFRMPLAVTIGVLVMLVPLLPLIAAGSERFEEDRFPEGAADVMDDVPTFHDDVAGGYLIWRFGPDRLVYIDDRAEFYKDQIKEYADVRDGREDWRPVFEDNGIEQVLMRVGQPLIDRLTDAGWRVTYRDEGYVVLEPATT